MDLRYEAVLGNGILGVRMVRDMYVNSHLLSHAGTSYGLSNLQFPPSVSRLLHTGPLKLVISASGLIESR